MGKKKGKKSTGKKGKKGKKSKEPQMTAKEAILAYQINVQEKKLEDIMYETRGWEEKNNRTSEMNEKLKSEQDLLIAHLLKQSRDMEDFFRDEELSGREDVVISMKEKWYKQREREQDIEVLKKEIEAVEEEITKVQKEVDHWVNYREKGQYDHTKQIQVLQQDINDMEMSFNEMSGHLEGTLEQTKTEIKRYTEDTLDKQKYLASEKAIAQLDKNSRQEVLDNDWLRREVEIHKRDVADLRQTVEDLEKGNLDIMSELFECKIEDLKISRQFYLTQFEDQENLDETGILEMDLAKLSLPDSQPSKMLAIEGPKARPQSAIKKAVEEKVFSLVTASIDTDESDAESTETDLLDNMYFEEEDFSDYLQLGPLELKLLNVSGNQMTIHEPYQLTKEELKVKECNPDKWPVTQTMLKEAIVTSNG
ncbi:hypothetical protein ScPMuIL_012662 [Solemya velum]